MATLIRRRVAVCRLAPGRRRGEAGFTLVEALVTLVILGFTMVAATMIFIHTTDLFFSYDPRLEDQHVYFALGRLRHDVHSSRRLPSLTPSIVWNHDALVLWGHPSGTIRYENLEGELVRVVQGPSGRVRESYVALREVAGWRWRQVFPGVVDVEVSFRRPAFGSARRRLQRPLRLENTFLETEITRLTLRGAGRGRMW